MEEIQAEAGKKIFSYNFAIKLHAGFHFFFLFFCFVLFKCDLEYVA